MSTRTPVAVTNSGFICNLNSTTADLGNGENFTGPWVNVVGVGAIVIGIKSDQDSATDGLKIEWSDNGVGVNVTQDDSFDILANIGKTFSFTPTNAYYRINYTNGVTPTTKISIQPIHKLFGFKGSSHRISDSIVAQDDAELVKAVLTGETPDGEFVNIGASETGNLKVSLQVDTASEHKFGFNDSIGTTRILVWDIDATYPAWPGDGVLTVESSVAGDTSIGISIVGLSSAGEEITETITTNGADGTTPEAGATTFASGVYRGWISAGTAPAGFISIKRGAAEVARINIGFGQTEMCRWIVPTIIDGVTYTGAFLKNLHVEVGANDRGNIYLTAETPTDVMPRVKRYYGNIQGPVVEEFTNGGTVGGIFFPAGTILQVDGEAQLSTIEVSASFLASMVL